MRITKIRNLQEKRLEATGWIKRPAGGWTLSQYGGIHNHAAAIRKQRQIDALTAALEADLGRGPVTHTAKRPDGREVQVTVPEDPDPAEILADALRENFSPHGIALMYSTLQTARCDDPNVEHEIANLWQHDLVNLVGGPDEMNRLCDEIGK